MNDPPRGESVRCPECGDTVIALVPEKSTVVEREENTDGKVRANCRNCGERFLVHYQYDG